MYQLGFVAVLATVAFTNVGQFVFQ